MIGVVSLVTCDSDRVAGKLGSGTEGDNEYTTSGATTTHQCLWSFALWSVATVFMTSPLEPIEAYILYTDTDRGFHCFRARFQPRIPGC